MAPTVEPLPPLSLELQFSDQRDWGGGGSASLLTDIVAGEEIEVLNLRLELPEGLVFSGHERLPVRQGRLRAGERRVRHLSVAARRDGEFSVRLEADVRMSDGRTFQVGQGATLRVGRPRPEGRLRNGAYEVRGVPRNGLSR